jgi:CcmD family protein
MRHVYRWMGLAALLLLVVAGGDAPAMAQPGETPTAAQDGFVPIDELPADDQLPAAPFLVTAYAAAWVLVLGYVWMLWRRLGRVERELGQARAAARPGP